MKKRHSVIPRTMCLVLHNDKILLIKASEKKEFHGYYDPPGGHIEKGESVMESAEREIFEETGIQVRESKLKGVIHVSGFYGKEVMLFVTLNYSNTIDFKGSEEGRPEWINISDLDRINLMEDVKPILKHTLELNKEQMFFGVSKFDGKDKLLSFDVKIA